MTEVDRLERGEGALVIQLDGSPAADTLRHIADLIEQGYSSGYYPHWSVTA
ncbi:hypothetical protein [Streptomyces sp. AC495_CC817]|uniref:hypothetical protein n=1 Tax=Streptomyces sp. AC495_CC817 TaxID=2823900 RepID=UPI001C27A900|nr:hypothetical protein [Streptomyces sp. AC495_CC817]